MSVIEFDPEDAHKAAKALSDVVVDANNGIEDPLRRISLPEMPAATRGAVQSQIAGAIATMANARVGVANIARDLKMHAQDAGVYDKVAGLPAWVSVGDAVISLTSLDAGYKTYHHDQYSKTEIATAWAGFGLNFVPISKIGKVGKFGAKLIRRTPKPKLIKVPRPPSGGMRPRPVTRPRPARPVSRPIRRPVTRPRPITRPRPVLRPPHRPINRPRPVHRPRPITKPTPTRPVRPVGVTDAASANALSVITAHAAAQLIEHAAFKLPTGATWLHSNRMWTIAADWAASKGFTIEMTSIGEKLGGKLTLKLIYDVFRPKAVADHYWNLLSKKFVEQSSGPINAVVRGAVNPDSVFAKTELRAILENTQIPKLTIRRLATATAETAEITISRSSRTAHEEMIKFMDANLDKDVIIKFDP